MKPNRPKHRVGPQPTARRLSVTAWLTFGALIAFCILSLHTSQRLTQAGGTLTATE